MLNSFWIRASIGLAAAIWFIGAALFNVSLDENVLLRTLGFVTTAVVALLAGFDLFLWRFLPALIIKRAYVGGTWKSELDSTWPGGSKTFYLVIRQTYSAVTVTSLFDISRSNSMTAAVSEHDGTLQLTYTYRSEAHSLQQQGNPPHRGTVVLDVSLVPERSLEGDYWTERNTKGRIKTLKRRRKQYNSFAAAERGFAESKKSPR